MTTSSKKTILFLSDVDYFKGGAEKSLFDAMATPTITPILAVPKKGDLSEYAKSLGIKSIEVDFGTVLNVRRPFGFLDGVRFLKVAWKAARALNAQAKAYGVDAVHTNGLKAHGVACLARLIGGMPVIVHYRSIPYTLAEKAFWRITQIIAQKIILVSRPCWPWKTLPKNTRVVFNGIKPMDRSLLSKRPAWPQNTTHETPFILGFVGRIHHSKGVHDLIEWFDDAYKKLRDEDQQHIRLSLRGEPAPDDLAYGDMVKSMVHDKGLSDVIAFEGQRTGYQDIYTDMDINVVSSVTPDPLPRSCMEASALGIPVLGYPAGGIPDMIDDTKNGFLIRNGAQLYALVKRFITEKGFYESIAQAAIHNAQSRFTLEALHTALANIYDDIPASSTSSGDGEGADASSSSSSSSATLEA